MANKPAQCSSGAYVMKRAKKFLGIPLVIYGGLALLLVFIFQLSSWETVTTKFATLDEAIAAGAFERGWLPPILPQGSTDIVEVNDMESSRGSGSFNFPILSLAAYLDALVALQPISIKTNAAIIEIELADERSEWSIEVDQSNGTGKYYAQIVGEYE